MFDLRDATQGSVADSTRMLAWPSGASAATDLRYVTAGDLLAAVPTVDFFVTEYGAVGDNVTDDTAAVQAAINAAEAAGGGRVVFPAGSFLITSRLTIDSNGVVLVGAGRRATVLRCTGAAGVTVASKRYCGLRDLWVAGSGTPTASGVRFEDTIESLLFNVTVSGFSASGKYGWEVAQVVGSGSTFYNHAIGCTFSGNANGVYASGQVFGLIGCRVQGNTADGVVDDCTGSTYVSTAFEGNGGRGAYLFQNRPKSFTGCYFESNGTKHIYAYAENALTVTGSYFFDGSANTPIGIEVGNTSGGVVRGCSITGNWFFNGHSTGDIVIRGAENAFVFGNETNSPNGVVVSGGAGLTAPYLVQGLEPVWS